MKGKILKKLKTIRPVDYLKQDRVLQIKALNGYVESFANSSSFNLKNLIVSRENEPRKVEAQEEPEAVDLSDYMMRDLDDKENVGPPCLRSKENVTSRSSKPTTLTEIDISSFRQPDMNSDSLFDPLLLAAFEQAVKEHVELRKSGEKIECFEELVEEVELSWKLLEVFEEKRPPGGNDSGHVALRKSAEKIGYVEERIEEKEEEEEMPWKILEVFEEKCPPGGNDSVILYTTTLRGIRKTFEDCNKIRFLVDSFKVVYIERDTSMHMKFKEELWKILDGKPLPPRLFIKGRYIGGVEEVLTLNEQGRLKPLFSEIPVRNPTTSCEGCDGVRFIICFSCNGSHKITVGEKEDEEKQSNLQCSDCNENGLIICPYCCCYN